MLYIKYDFGDNHFGTQPPPSPLVPTTTRVLHEISSILQPGDNTHYALRTRARAMQPSCLRRVVLVLRAILYIHGIVKSNSRTIGTRKNHLANGRNWQMFIRVIHFAVYCCVYLYTSRELPPPPLALADIPRVRFTSTAIDGLTSSSTLCVPMYLYTNVCDCGIGRAGYLWWCSSIQRISRPGCCLNSAETIIRQPHDMARI